jgi:hypothetical protein
MRIKDLTESTEMTYEEKLKSEQYVLKMNIQDIVQIPEWQKLRSYFVGKWKSQPEKNLQMLKDFAGDLNKLSNRRLRIVQNYVTGSAFRIGIISSKELTDFVEQVRKEVVDRKADGRWK